MSTPVAIAEHRAGSKAAALFELQRAGFCVPEFEVVTAECNHIPEIVGRIGFPLAVRSSAMLEDGVDNSFAGQFESYLNLGSLAEVEEAVKNCFESVRAPAAVAYCRARGVDPSTVRMAVMIQRMIEPDLAGVMFTVCPTTGAEEVVVEACQGLADRLMQGVAAALPGDHAILRKHLPRLKDVARQIQRHFGAPQDIEFAMANDILYILQSRPITKIEFAGNTEEWTNANFRDGGVSSSVCSPLMWSLYEFIWDQTLKGCLREIGLYRGDFVAGRMFFGRPYWNLAAVKEAVANIPGFVEREFDDDLCVHIGYPDAGRRTPVTLWTLLRAIPTLIALPGFFRRQEQQAQQQLAKFGAMEKRWEASGLQPAALWRDLIERDYLRMESTYFRTIFAVSLAKLDFKKSFPGCDYVALVAALPELRHMAPLQQMRAMAARGQRDLSPLVAAFRHHCQRGVDIRHPRWDEDLGFVEELFANLTPAAGKDPRPEYQRARSEALARLPWWKRRTFQRKLDRLRRLLWLREELRDLSGRMYYLIRRQVLAIAAERGLGADIFFQTFREIHEDDRREIEPRREIFESYRNFQPPNEIGRRFRYQSCRAAGAMRGIGASGGMAVGTARIARNPQEALRAEAGSILICPFTEPGWTLVLDRVSGLVTETGGQLSHAAVLCREYGIPAVLGVPQATQRIKDGERVAIDGYKGLVDIQGGAGSAARPPG